VSAVSQYAALALALCSLLLALAALGPLPAHLISNPLAAGELTATLLVVLGGVLLAQGLSQRPLFGAATAHTPPAGGPLRRAAGAIGATFERVDLLARGWTVACLSLLALALLFGGILFFGARG
jgi:hypothetical protein